MYGRTNFECCNRKVNVEGLRILYRRSMFKTQDIKGLINSLVVEVYSSWIPRHICYDEKKESN